MTLLTPEWFGHNRQRAPCLVGCRLQEDAQPIRTVAAAGYVPRVPTTTSLEDLPWLERFQYPPYRYASIEGRRDCCKKPYGDPFQERESLFGFNGFRQDSWNGRRKALCGSTTHCPFVDFRRQDAINVVRLPPNGIVSSAGTYHYVKNGRQVCDVRVTRRLPIDKAKAVCMMCMSRMGLRKRTTGPGNGGGSTIMKRVEIALSVIDRLIRDETCGGGGLSSSLRLISASENLQKGSRI